MIGNRVRLFLDSGVSGSQRQTMVTGLLHRLDQSGALVWRECSIPEGEGATFIPMHRIYQIIDLGRAP
jgi:hypothetical protein